MPAARPPGVLPVTDTTMPARPAVEGTVFAVILAVSKIETGAVYDIEGHTSTDGTDEFNMNLSAARAQRSSSQAAAAIAGMPARRLSRASG